MLIRAATFDLLRCMAFAGVVAGATVLLRRLLRARPSRRAELPEARIGDHRTGGFIARIAPVVIVLGSLAALAASTRIAHRALVITERGGAMRVAHDVSLGDIASTRDLDGDVWVINRSSRALRCIHEPFGSWAYSPEAFVIPPGEAGTLPRIPQNIGPDDQPREWEGESLWLTWER
ncbi:MAG TPA: hypothetical protein VH143_20335 [Kofleriaceae bacterium]|nr:hypothetical protein [Kofleriaceae bacterium]